MSVLQFSGIQILLVLAKFKVFQNCVTIQSKVVAKTLFLFFCIDNVVSILNFKEMVGLNIQTMVLCVFSGGGKWKLEKGKIIQEILRIPKISFKEYSNRGNTKKSAKYDFFQYKFIEELQFDFRREKKGEGFQAVFFFDFFAFSNRFCQLYGKKVDFFFIDLSTKL